MEGWMGQMGSCCGWHILSTVQVKVPKHQECFSFLFLLVPVGSLRSNHRNAPVVTFKEMAGVALILPSGSFCRAAQTTFVICISHYDYTGNGKIGCLKGFTLNVANLQHWFKIFWSTWLSLAYSLTHLNSKHCILPMYFGGFEHRDWET